MAAVPKRDEVWVDRRPMTDRREWRDDTKFRRVVTVAHYSPHGWVEGLSTWQEKTREGWTTMEYPPSRSTRILAHVFMRRFVPADPKDGTE
jgi:hypothetical protein